MLGLKFKVSGPTKKKKETAAPNKRAGRTQILYQPQTNLLSASPDPLSLQTGTGPLMRYHYHTLSSVGSI